MKIVCESFSKEKITFQYKFPFFITSLSGFHEVLGSVVTSKSAYGIGEKYISTGVNKRNLLIECAFKNDDIDKRKKIYRIFALKTKGTLYYYEKEINRKIDYYVENVKVDTVGLHKKAYISLICPSPYYLDIEPSIYKMASWSPLFKFSLIITASGIIFGEKNTTLMSTIENNSNIENGLTINFKANDTVVNPSLFNVDSREELKIDITLSAGDLIIVHTQRQNKNIYYIPAKTGVEENVNNLLVYGSKFLQVHLGSNTFRCDADEGVNNLEVEIEHYTEYEAV